MELDLKTKLYAHLVLMIAATIFLYYALNGEFLSDNSMKVFYIAYVINLIILVFEFIKCMKSGGRKVSSILRYCNQNNINFDMISEENGVYRVYFKNQLVYETK